MKPDPKQTAPNSSRINFTEKSGLNRYVEFAPLALLLGIAFLVRYLPHLYLQDLRYVPDSVEYALSALSLAEGTGYFIHINHLPFPSRYPFGYPLLLAPVYWLGGDEPAVAIYLSLFLGIASIIIVYMIGRKVFGSWIGLLAAAWLTLAPEHIYLSQMILSDLASLLFFLLAIYMALIVKHPPGFILLGFVLGYLFLIRPVNLVVLPAFHFLLWPKTRSVYPFILAGLLPVVASLSIYNWLIFGSPFETGYDYWAPEWYGEIARTFNWAYLWPSSRTGEGNLTYYLRLLAGISNSYYPFYIFLAGVYGAYVGRKQPFVRFSILAAVLVTVIYLFYFYRGPRLLIQIGTIWLIVAAYGLDAITQLLLRKFNYYSAARHRLLFAGVALISCLLLPWTVIITGSYLWRTQVDKIELPVPAKYQIAQIIDQRIEPDAYILTRIEAPYVDHYILRNTARVHIPISRAEEDYYSRPPVRQKNLPVAVEQLDMLQSIVESGAPVYLDDTSCPQNLGYWGGKFHPSGPDECASLRQAFRLEPVFELYGWHLYRLQSQQN